MPKDMENVFVITGARHIGFFPYNLLLLGFVMVRYGSLYRGLCCIGIRYL